MACGFVLTGTGIIMLKNSSHSICIYIKQHMKPGADTIRRKPPQSAVSRVLRGFCVA